MHLRPSAFTSKNGKQIRVRQQVAHANDRRLKRGKVCSIYPNNPPPLIFLSSLSTRLWKKSCVLTNSSSMSSPGRNASVSGQSLATCTLHSSSLFLSLLQLIDGFNQLVTDGITVTISPPYILHHFNTLSEGTARVLDHTWPSRSRRHCIAFSHFSSLSASDPSPRMRCSGYP